LLKFQSEARLDFSIPKKLVERVQSATNAATIFGRLPQNLMRDVEQ
jgi:hypothetical protein